MQSLPQKAGILGLYMQFGTKFASDPIVIYARFILENQLQTGYQRCTLT